MATILIILGSLITLSAGIPYLIDIQKGKTKPRVVSWLIWAILAIIAGIATLANGEYLTAVEILSLALMNSVIFVFSIEKGNKKISFIDIICLIGALVAILLWAIFNSPLVAVVASIIASFIGGVPTIIHAFKKPKEETLSNYFLAFIGSTIALLGIDTLRIIAFIYPLYIVLINLTYSLIIYTQRRALKYKKKR